MEKLITACMANPTPENKAKMFRYDRKHPMAVCVLPLHLQVIYQQYARENPGMAA